MAGWGKMPTTSQRRPTSRLSRSSALVDQIGSAVLERKTVEGEDVDLGLLQHRHQLGKASLEEAGDAGDGLAGALTIGLREDGAHRRRHHLLRGLGIRILLPAGTPCF
jgi:hypothetical protein